MEEMNASEKSARQWATIIHLSPLVGLLGNGIGFVLAPLILWLIKRNDHPFIDDQGKEAVNFQITMSIATLAGALLLVIGIGFIIIAVAVALATIFPILAAIKSSDGVAYRFPFSIRFIK